DEVVAAERAGIHINGWRTGGLGRGAQRAPYVDAAGNHLDWYGERLPCAFGQEDDAVRGAKQPPLRRLRHAVEHAARAPVAAVDVLLGERAAVVENQPRAAHPLCQRADGRADVAAPVEEVDALAPRDRPR